jgi:hypothetical protein
MEAVKTCGWALEDVPEHLKTLELCIEALKQEANALEYVPEHLREQVKNAFLY